MKFTVQTKILISFSLLCSFLFLILVIGYLYFRVYMFPTFLIFSLFFLLAAAIFLSKKITKPIKKLQQVTELFERGQLNTDIKIESGDEIENIFDGFSNIVTRLAQREKLLTREKIETEALLASLTDGVIALDQQGTVLTFNKAAENTSGFSASDVVGKNIDTVLHFYDGLEIVLFSVYSQQKGSLVKDLQEKGLNLNKKDQTKVRLALTINPVIFEDQKTGFILAFHDISKEQELEEMKLDFVSMAAHELRTPLTAIRGYSSILQMQNAKDLSEAGKDLLKRLVVSSENLGNLVENLLSVSRIEKSVFSISTKPVDLVSTIKATVDTVRQQAYTKKQTITLMIPDQLPVVIADVFRIGQVILNLIANAVNYTQIGGNIVVKAEKIDNMLQISVKDNGPGVPKEAQQKLFTKFFRVSGALQQGSKGTGLGLYISKAIIESHKGKIWVESEGTGKGSTFVFSLPIASTVDVEVYEKNRNMAAASGEIMVNKAVN